jgi:uncharacterized OB-fold protein
MEKRPAPIPNADTKPFWEACNREELIYQYCGSCGQAQFYPRTLCAHCRALALGWRTSKGLGTIYTYTVNFRAPSSSFASEVPYVIALVDLDEGFRMMLNVKGCPPEAVRIGMRIKVVFESRGDQKIPQATPENFSFPL